MADRKEKKKSIGNAAIRHAKEEPVPPAPMPTTQNVTVIVCRRTRQQKKVQRSLRQSLRHRAGPKPNRNRTTGGLNRTGCNQCATRRRAPRYGTTAARAEKHAGRRENCPTNPPEKNVRRNHEMGRCPPGITPHRRPRNAQAAPYRGGRHERMGKTSSL